MKIEDKHLEVLSRVSRVKVVRDCDLDDYDLIAVSDLVNLEIVSREKRNNPDMPQDEEHFYSMTDKGREYLNRILKYASCRI